MHFLVTGHTGFKGAWLVMLLRQLGHDVSGISLDPEPGSLYERARLTSLMANDIRLDIRDATGVISELRRISPDFVLHLAAQPLVRRSYLEPRFTVETNVMGTFNVLEAASEVSNLKGMVLATTDKVYRNINQIAGYVEDNPLGGDDPYSSSKAMADLLIQSWVTSFPGAPTAIVRGGNVIGGGDVSADRLLVDLLAGFTAGKTVEIRYPEAVRPWQHVLDCLNGYLTVAAGILKGNISGAWNIGPDERSFVSVADIARDAAVYWGEDASWKDVSSQLHLHEAGLLALDAGKANKDFGWRDYIPYPESLEWTIEWTKKVHLGTDAFDTSQAQINKFLELAGKVSVIG